MQARKGKNARVTIPIEVQTSENAKSGVCKGTFKSPWPKVLVKVNDLVRWQIAKDQTFTLTFIPCKGTIATSPFKKTRVTGEDGFLQVVNPGHFHYKVSVTHTNGAKWQIKHCPEFGVGN